jgi:hypothetical protein
MSSHCRWFLGIICVLCFFARTAGATDFYWDTVAGVNNGLTAGSGDWSTFLGGGNAQKWTLDPGGTATLQLWTNSGPGNDNAHFVANGTSPVTVLGSVFDDTEIKVSQMIFDGTGYIIEGTGDLFLISATITTNANATISDPMQGILGMTKQGNANLTSSGGNRLRQHQPDQ